MQLRKRLSHGIALGVIGVTLAFPMFGSAEPGELSSQTASLAAIQLEFDQAQDNLREIGRQLEETQGRIVDTQNSLEALNLGITQTRENIAKTIEDLETAQFALAAYLQITYKSGVLSFLDVILASSDFNDFVTRTYYASAVQNSQVETIYEIKDLKIQLENYQIELAGQLEEESQLLVVLESEEALLEQQRMEADLAVSALSVEVQTLFAQQQSLLSAANAARTVAANAAEAGASVGVYNVGISQGSVTENAYACLGMPYVWGGDDENYSTYLGYDCSGFAQHCYALEGYSIGRTTWDQIDDIQARGNWKYTVEELEPGDLVFPYDGHVGIYIGNGQMIDAPFPGAYIQIDPVGEIIGGGSPI